jgi:hypothetical protein
VVHTKKKNFDTGLNFGILSTENFSHEYFSKQDLSIVIKICDLDLGIFLALIFEWSAVEL